MSEHPYKTGSNIYYMNPSNLIGLGINIDEQCVVCGKDQKDTLYYIDEGLIHCIECAIKHKHITKEEYEKENKRRSK